MGTRPQAPAAAGSTAKRHVSGSGYDGAVRTDPSITASVKVAMTAKPPPESGRSRTGIAMRGTSDRVSAEAGAAARAGGGPVHEPVPLRAAYGPGWYRLDANGGTSWLRSTPWL